MRKKLNFKIVLLHSFFWLYELVFVIHETVHFPTTAWFMAIFIALFYFHYYVLVPKIIKQPSGASIFKWFLVFILLEFLRKQLDYYIGWNYLRPMGWVELSVPYDFSKRFTIMVFTSMSNICGILAVSLGSRFIKNREQFIILEKEKVKNELSALKNQIDIPGIIEILNELEKRAKFNPSSIQGEIIQLSHILRYHLYSKEGEVTLNKELEVVKNQLELFNQLHSKKIVLSTDLKNSKIKTGLLSKIIAELLKIKLEESPALQVNQERGKIILEIKTFSRLEVMRLKDQFDKVFKNHLIATLNENVLLIQLN